MTNYYLDIAKLNFNLIIGSLFLLGSLSVVITIWYKIEMKQFFESNKTQIFHYKNSKIIWSALVIGLMTILIGKDLDSQIKTLTFSIGIYLVFSQIIEYLAGKYFNTNILAITENSLVDLNGRINRVKYKNIKAYENKSDSLVIHENWETLKFRTKDFKNSSKLIEIVDEKLNKKEKKPADNKR